MARRPPLPQQPLTRSSDRSREEEKTKTDTGDAHPARGDGELCVEDAARFAWMELIRWLATDYGVEPLEAYQLLTQAGRMRVGNMVDPQYSLVAKLDKRNDGQARGTPPC
jgi:acetamidase/formamidase